MNIFLYHCGSELSARTIELGWHIAAFAEPDPLAGLHSWRQEPYSDMFLTEATDLFVIFCTTCFSRNVFVANIKMPTKSVVNNTASIVAWPEFFFIKRPVFNPACAFIFTLVFAMVWPRRRHLPGMDETPNPSQVGSQPAMLNALRPVQKRSWELSSKPP